jgi:hypothetical protein
VQGKSGDQSPHSKLDPPDRTIERPWQPGDIVLSIRMDCCNVDWLSKLV